jgi:hypothetical protein
MSFIFENLSEKYSRNQAQLHGIKEMSFDKADLID